jgi:hypothetical protein
MDPDPNQINTDPKHWPPSIKYFVLHRWGSDSRRQDRRWACPSCPAWRAGDPRPGAYSPPLPTILQVGSLPAKGECPQRNELTRGPPEFGLVWLNRSPIPVGKGGGVGNFLVQMISTCLPSRRGRREWGSAPCESVMPYTGKVKEKVTATT